MSKKTVHRDPWDPCGYPKFGMRDKLAYAAGDFGCNMSFSLKSTVQTFWLAYMMMETGLLSALLLVVQIWDAVNDPMIGSMIDADKRRYKRGKFKQYIFVGSCGLLFAGAAVFLPFPNAPMLLKAILFVLGYLVWDAAYTVANVPYGSMLSLVTEDPGERAQLSTWRSLGSMIGTLIPGILLPMLIWRKEWNSDGTPLLNPKTGVQVQTLLGERVFWAALLMGGLGFLAFRFMLKNITLRVDENTVSAGEEGLKYDPLGAFGNFLRNRPAVGATLAAMGMFLGMQSANVATSIMFATWFGMAELSGIVQLIAYLPMFLFMPFIKRIVDRFGKKEAGSVGTFLCVVGGMVMLIFPMLGKGLGMAVYLGGLVLFGLGMGVYTCISWALMADAIDYNEWKTGKREEGTVYSLHSFFRKLSQGIGPSAVLLLMGALGYVADLGTGGQSAATAYNMCWLVAGLYLFSGVTQFIGIAFVYNLDRKTLARMNAELAERKAKK